jgi:hypothetical protein
VIATLKAHPTDLDLALYAGDGVTLAFTFTDGSIAWPTTGAWAAEIRSCEGGDVVTSFTVVNDEVAGVVTLSLSGDQVRSLGESAVYDLQQIAPGAEPKTWYRGRITIEGDVTRG